MTKAFDIFDLRPSTDEIEVKLKHPFTGEEILKADGNPQTITLAAPYSPEFKKASHEVANRRIDRIAKSKDSDAKSKLDAESMDQDNLDLLVLLTKRFDLESAGKPVKFSKEAVKDLYENLVGIRDQAEAALADTGNFMKA